MTPSSIIHSFYSVILLDTKLELERHHLGLINPSISKGYTGTIVYFTLHTVLLCPTTFPSSLGGKEIK